MLSVGKKIKNKTTIIINQLNNNIMAKLKQQQYTGVEIVAIMSEGNPGAIQAMCDILSTCQRIYPYLTKTGYNYIALLDKFGIYGTDIYVLYNDICERKVGRMLSVLKATRLGMFKLEVLQDAVSRQDYSGKDLVPVDELYEKLKKEKIPLNLDDI